MGSIPVAVSGISVSLIQEEFSSTECKKKFALPVFSSIPATEKMVPIND